ncbi:MFS transporter [Marispirochaeta aestuarii]|uniref:MFS transporter n=1 Tax=Marispirochaeta aestuarii TaxID=1963862 RepID=UPI002ABD958E|nr:MFS transporter [Marispirochaeta aestuarii]
MSTGQSPAVPTRFPLGSTLLVVNVFFMTFVARAILSPLLLTVQEEMGLSHAQGGGLFLVISAGLMTSMLLSGFILKFITHHVNIALAACLSGSALYLLSMAKDPALLRLGLFFLGAASGLYLPSGVVTITEIVPARQRGMGIAFHEVGPILGFASAPFFAELALRFADWRSFLLILGTVTISSGIIYARFGRGGSFHGTPPLWSELALIIRQRDFWIIAFFFILALGAEAGIYSMLPSYLIAEKGIDRAFVNSMVGTSRLTALLMIFTSGYLADRFGYKRVIAAVLLSCGTVTAVLGIATGVPLIAAVYLQPMLVCAFFPAGFIAMSGVSGSRQRNLPVSLTIPLAYLFGGGMIPALIGRLAEQGAFGAGFVFAGILMATGAVLVPFMKTQVR